MPVSSGYKPIEPVMLNEQNGGGEDEVQKTLDDIQNFLLDDEDV
jgi:hypothetical protein